MNIFKKWHRDNQFQHWSNKESCNIAQLTYLLSNKLIHLYIDANLSSYAKFSIGK